MANTFETGASTAAANNLILCVTNTADDYRLRQHAGFAALAHGYDRGYRPMRELAQTRANVERKAGRGRFSAGAVSDAARILLAQSIDDAKESILNNWTGERFTVTGRLWMDRANGNTYHSVSVDIPTRDTVRGREVCAPLQYGYGDQWERTGVQLLKALGFKNLENLPRSEMPIQFFSQGYMKKSCAFEGLRGFSY